jgi:CMP-N-acetylneuraminic acid synthetase
VVNKSLNDICFIIQARLNSTRVPRKMIKPFLDTTLMELGIQKVLDSKIIPMDNFYCSVYEEELVKLCEKCGVNVFHRSEESANEENTVSGMYEWHDKLPYKYVVLISACIPLLKTKTIDKFVEKYMNSDSDGLFGVIGKKQYYWNEEGNMITKWPEGFTIMNTKEVDTTYEAAHSLYASRMDTIKDEIWMGDAPFTKGNPELFKMDELEVFDIDYPWQFEMGEILYEKFKIQKLEYWWNNTYN